VSDLVTLRTAWEARSPYLRGEHFAEPYITALEAEVERLRDAIRTFVYANDTEPGLDRPITTEQWERAWEAALDGLRKALEGATL